MTDIAPIIAQRPTDVIDLRRELVEFFSRDGKLQRAFAMQSRVPIPGHPYPPEKEGYNARRWFYETLRHAELYWVSPEMVDVLAAVAPTIPDTLPLPPMPEAMVVFAKPLAGLDSQTKTTIHTAAYLWGPVTMATLQDCFAVDTFAWRDFMQPRLDEIGEVHWNELVPTHLVNTGGAEWPIDEPISSVLNMQETGPGSRDSIIEDRRVMAAFWALCNQRITTETFELGDRPARRRSERAGITKLNPVRVIKLREVERRTAEGEAGAVDWSHRWIVGAHWRRQWHPSKNAHVPTLIQAHVKGPKDKPLLIRETVRALVR
jgi:hypothetical protein